MKIWKSGAEIITDYISYTLAKSKVPNMYIVGEVGFFK